MANLPDPFHIILILVSLALVPFAAVMVTSYIKLVIVLSLVRNALGIQQIPPNMVINGLAIILSIYIMAPVGQDIYQALEGKDFSGVHQRSIWQSGCAPAAGELLGKRQSDRRSLML